MFVTTEAFDENIEEVFAFCAVAKCTNCLDKTDAAFLLVK
jgi:hypothetical protein